MGKGGVDQILRAVVVGHVDGDGQSVGQCGG